MVKFQIWRDRRGQISPLRIAALALLLLPLALAAWNAEAIAAGARPVNDLIHRAGFWALMLLLVTLAITPLRRISRFGQLINIRRRLGGSRWQSLHQIVYVIAFLALIHYFQQTKADVSAPTLVAGLFAWLMSYRIVVRRIRGELSSAGIAVLSVVVAALTLLAQSIGVAIVFHVSPLTVLQTAFTFYFDFDLDNISDTLQSVVDNVGMLN